MQEKKLKIGEKEDLVKWDEIALGRWLVMTILAHLIYIWGVNLGVNSLNYQTSWTHESNYLISGTPTN